MRWCRCGACGVRRKHKKSSHTFSVAVHVERARLFPISMLRVTVGVSASCFILKFVFLVVFPTRFKIDHRIGLRCSNDDSTSIKYRTQDESLHSNKHPSTGSDFRTWSSDYAVSWAWLCGLPTRVQSILPPIISWGWMWMKLTIVGEEARSPVQYYPCCGPLLFLDQSMNPSLQRLSPHELIIGYE